METPHIKNYARCTYLYAMAGYKYWRAATWYGGGPYDWVPMNKDGTTPWIIAPLNGRSPRNRKRPAKQLVILISCSFGAPVGLLASKWKRNENNVRN